MSFPNVSDIVASTTEKRRRKIADNVTKNNAVYTRLSQKGKIQPFSGGSVILEELSFAENGNFGWYSGYDPLPVAAQDVISAAQFNIKQCAVPVVISGLEQLQNDGEEAQFDLIAKRIGVAEATMANNMASAIYSDGTGYGGKQLGGLQAAVPLDPTTGTYGSIDRALWPFWRPQLYSAGANPTAANIQAHMNAAFAKGVRGKDRFDLVLFDNNLWGVFIASLQALQRFVNVDTAKLGFPSIEYMGADVVLDGGIGGFAPAWVGWFLNTDYIFLRPHAKRNMVALSPNRRVAINQDAEVQILGWAGNVTVSNSSLQLYFKGS